LKNKKLRIGKGCAERKEFSAALRATTFEKGRGKKGGKGFKRGGGEGLEEKDRDALHRMTESCATDSSAECFVKKNFGRKKEKGRDLTPSSWSTKRVSTRIQGRETMRGGGPKSASLQEKPLPRWKGGAEKKRKKGEKKLGENRGTGPGAVTGKRNRAPKYRREERKRQFCEKVKKKKKKKNTNRGKRSEV